jgi:hypothetical protein
VNTMWNRIYRNPAPHFSFSAGSGN